MVFNKEYPYKGPELVSLNENKHPNIDVKTGILYLEIVNEYKWLPTYTIKNVLVELKDVIVFINLKYIPKNQQNIEMSKKYNGKQEMIIEENNDEDTDDENQMMKQTGKVFNFDLQEGSDNESSHVSKFSQCLMEEEQNMDDSNDTESEGKSSCPQFVDLSIKPKFRYIEEQQEDKQAKQKIV